MTLEEIQRYYAEEVGESPFLGFQVDSAPVAEELEAVVQLLEEDCDLWKGEDISAAIAEAQERTREAGIDAVLEEFNRQAEEFWNKK